MNYLSFDSQIIFKKKDENEEYDQQSKLAQQYARLDPNALNSAMDESKHYQVRKDILISVRFLSTIVIHCFIYQS